jgi:hypothetical protein
MLLAKKNILTFIQGFKSAIMAIFHIWQNGTFEPLHEFQIFLAKSITKVTLIKNFQKMSHGPPNP